MNSNTFPSFSIILLVLCTENPSTLAERALHIRSISTDFNPKYFYNLTLTLKDNSINTDLTIIRPIVRGLKVFLDFKMALKNSKQYQTLFQQTIEVCRILYSLKNSLFKRYFKSLLQQGNFKANCPVKVGHYFFKDWRVDSKLIPPYIYPGNYRVSARCFYGELKKPNEDLVTQLEFDFYIQ